MLSCIQSCLSKRNSSDGRISDTSRSGGKSTGQKWKRLLISTSSLNMPSALQHSSVHCKSTKLREWDSLTSDFQGEGESWHKENDYQNRKAKRRRCKPLLTRHLQRLPWVAERLAVTGWSDVKEKEGKRILSTTTLSVARTLRGVWEELGVRDTWIVCSMLHNDFFLYVLWLGLVTDSIFDAAPASRPVRVK